MLSILKRFAGGVLLAIKLLKAFMYIKKASTLEKLMLGMNIIVYLNLQQRKSVVSEVRFKSCLNDFFLK